MVAEEAWRRSQASRVEIVPADIPWGESHEEDHVFSA